MVVILLPQAVYQEQQEEEDYGGTHHQDEKCLRVELKRVESKRVLLEEKRLLELLRKDLLEENGECGGIRNYTAFIGKFSLLFYLLLNYFHQVKIYIRSSRDWCQRIKLVKCSELINTKGILLMMSILVSSLAHALSTWTY